MSDWNCCRNKRSVAENQGIDQKEPEGKKNAYCQHKKKKKKNKKGKAENKGQIFQVLAQLVKETGIKIYTHVWISHELFAVDLMLLMFVALGLQWHVNIL